MLKEPSCLVFPLTIHFEMIESETDRFINWHENTNHKCRQRNWLNYWNWYDVHWCDIIEAEPYCNMQLCWLQHRNTKKTLSQSNVPNALTLFATKFIDDFANQIQKMIYCHFKLCISARTRESYWCQFCHRLLVATMRTEQNQTISAIIILILIGMRLLILRLSRFIYAMHHLWAFQLWASVHPFGCVFVCQLGRIHNFIVSNPAASFVLSV